MSPRQRQAELILRNHASWHDSLIASVTGLTEAEVGELRRELEAAPCPGRR